MQIGSVFLVKSILIHAIEIMKDTNNPKTIEYCYKSGSTAYFITDNPSHAFNHRKATTCIDSSAFIISQALLIRYVEYIFIDHTVSVEMYITITINSTD